MRQYKTKYWNKLHNQIKNQVKREKEKSQQNKNHKSIKYIHIRMKLQSSRLFPHLKRHQ